MTQVDLDVSELLACARYGELDELKEEVARMQAEHPGLTATSILGRANDSGNTALHMASANGHSDIVAYLLEHLLAAHIDAVNAQGNTPLHWCALNGHVEVAQLLIKAGADLAIVNSSQHTPLIEAQDAGHEKMAVELLKHMDPDMDEGAEDAAEAGSREDVTAQTEAGASSSSPTA
ncbi:ankyrin repeat-containing protein [Blastocladiella emersonii ATCC 22665]|nr:ankyrin repeat-containing protein [Blastocladiella emersonii ATCC 22665]